MSDSASYFEQLTDHYKQVRARLNAGPPPPWRQPVLPMPEPHPPEPEPDAPELPPASFQYTMSAAKRIAQAALVPHGMTWTEAMGPSRTLPYTAARADVYKALRKHGWSLKKIAIYCGRDHTTIMNALQPKKERKK
tara:strand:- start:144 stop:551 length:408 start_codon:yes stop_codon:yes gene_type:complete